MERIEYDKMAAFEGTMWWYRALHARLLDRLVAAAPDRGLLLDAGCGTGGLLARLGTARPDLALRGLEFDAQAAETARGKSSAAIAIGSVHAMPYPDACFDAIVSADVLCHARVDPGAALTELHRCLKPGGLVLLNLPAFAWMLSAHDADVHNVRRFTKGGTERALCDAGFVEIEAGYWNGLLFPLMALHRLRPRDKATSDVRAFPSWQNNLLLSATELERSVARRGLRLPFGGSVWAVARRA